jgi:hypothetical protein
MTDPESLVRSHDDAQTLIRYAAPGAHVTFEMKTLRSCGYEIVLRRDGREDMCVVGAYTLPCLANRIREHAREQVEKEINRNG